MSSSMIPNPILQIPENWNLSNKELYEIYLVEKKQSKIIREEEDSKKRKKLYSSTYDDYFKKLPFHPQFKVKDNKIIRDSRLKFQFNQIKKILNKNDVFVEIGAGDCSLTIQSSNYCKEAIALEVSEEIIKGLNFTENSKCLIFDGFNFPINDNYAGLAYSNQLMEHLHPSDAIEQVSGIFKFLKKGGAYICITPNGINGPHDISKFYGDKLVGFHLKEYKITELKKLFTLIGFSKVKFYTIIKKKVIYIPYIFIVFSENFLLLFSIKLRRKIYNWPILSRIMNATVMAIK
jgi:hypothetical protein